MSHIITTPGKFEGELSFVPKLWDMTLESMEDETLWDGDTLISIFRNCPKLWETIGEEHGLDFEFEYVAMYEDSQGFVHTEYLTVDDYTALIRRLEEE